MWLRYSNDYIYLFYNNTTAAVTLLCLSCNAFFYSLIRFFIFKRKNIINVWIAIGIATIGIIIIALGNTEKSSLIGLIFGMTSSIGFSVFSVTLRWRKETPKFTTVAVAGLFCVIVALIFIAINDLVIFQQVIMVHYFHFMEQ